jgi:DNA-binding NarL/FixJ family response regulator
MITRSPAEPMENQTIRTAIISTDSDLRRLVRNVVAADELGIDVGLEVVVPFHEINDSHLEQLRQLNPDLIFLDVSEDPVMGLKFAQFLVEGAPNRRVVGMGTELTPDLLMQAMQAGVTEYLPKPVTPEKVQDSIDRLARKFGHRSADDRKREPGKLFAFFSPKGGGGSTSVATNTAVQLHLLTRKRVLLVDLDLELGETALLLGVEPRFSFVDLVRNFHRVDAGLLASYIERHESGVELLSAPFHPAKAETVTGDQIRQILHFLKQHYDYVIVDSSKSFTAPTLATFEQSDAVFLVTNVDLPSLRNITRCLPLLERMGSVKGDDWARYARPRPGGGRDPQGACTSCWRARPCRSTSTSARSWSADPRRDLRPRPARAAAEGPEVSDILVNTYAPGDGRAATASSYPTDVRFKDDRHLLQIIDRIVSAVGRRIDDSSPMVDARLPDGSRVNAIIPPLASTGRTCPSASSSGRAVRRGPAPLRRS